MTAGHARILTAGSRSAIAARLAESFDSESVAGLLAAHDTRILAVDTPGDAHALELAAVLRTAGAVAVTGGPRVATVASAAMLARAAAAEPRFAADCAKLDVALGNALEPPLIVRLRGRTLDIGAEARVMGILNVTPDSFYERVGGTVQAVERAQAFAAAGAALVDIGGQSYAHWNAPVSAAEERGRVVPAIAAIVAAGIDLALSVDTHRASVADAALAAGAHLINDCSGLADPDLAATVAKYDAGLIVMHLRGKLNVRSPLAYRYTDALAEIVDFLYERTQAARAAGVAADSIAIDPGLEFGKEPQTDLEILDRFGELTALGYPILLAGSRKSFIGRIFARPAADLLVPSLATAGLGIAAGARILRVHDVAETVALARMYAAIAPQRRAGMSFAAKMPGTPDAAGNLAVPAAVRTE